MSSCLWIFMIKCLEMGLNEKLKKKLLVCSVIQNTTNSSIHSGVENFCDRPGVRPANERLNLRLTEAIPFSAYTLLHLQASWFSTKRQLEKPTEIAGFYMSKKVCFSLSMRCQSLKTLMQITSSQVVNFIHFLYCSFSNLTAQIGVVEWGSATGFTWIRMPTSLHNENHES